MRPEDAIEGIRYRSLLVYLNPFWPASGAHGLQTPFSPYFQDAMAPFFRAFEKTITLSILHMSNMELHYAEAFQRLNLLGYENLPVGPSLVELGSDVAAISSPVSDKLASSNTIFLSDMTVRILTRTSMDLQTLAHCFHNFLPTFSNLKKEISALVYCIHRVRATADTASTDASQDTFHTQARAYFREFLSSSIIRINDLLQSCPLLLDGYVAKMLCVAQLLNLQDTDGSMQDEITRELLKVADMGIERGSVLLALYDDVKYYERSSNNESAYLIYLSQYTGCLRHGLIVTWYSLRAYKVNLLRQLGQLDRACAEARALMRLLTSNAHTAIIEDTNTCTCLNTAFSDTTSTQEPADTFTTKPIISQQTSYVPLLSSYTYEYMQLKPIPRHESDDSACSFDSQGMNISKPTIKYPSLRTIYTSLSLLCSGLDVRHDTLNIRKHITAGKGQVLHTLTNGEPALRDILLNYSEANNDTARCADEGFHIKPNETNSQSESESAPSNMSQSCKDNVLNTMGCLQHGMSFWHLDYRLVYLLTILSAGCFTEAFNYLISGVFRTELFASLLANLNYNPCYGIANVIDSSKSSKPNKINSITPIYYYKHSFEKSTLYRKDIKSDSTDFIDAYANLFTKYHHPPTSNLIPQRTRRLIYRRPNSYSASHRSVFRNHCSVRRFMTNQQKLLTSILFQRAYKYVDNVSLVDPSSQHNSVLYQKLVHNRLKPSTNFQHYLKAALDSKLLMIITDYFRGYICGPLSRILFYGPYYQFKYNGDSSDSNVGDVYEFSDLISSAVSASRGELQSQAICFSFHTPDQGGKSSTTSTISYPVIDAPAPSFLPSSLLSSQVDLECAQLPIGLYSTPLSAVTTTYTLLLLILQQRATWANDLVQSIFANHTLGCNCVVPSMLLEKNIRVIDLATSWPKTCVHVKFIPALLFSDRDQRPPIPSINLLRLAFSSNPYVVEYLLAKSVLPSKDVLHCLTLLFNIQPCTDPSDLLDIISDENLAYPTYKKAMKMWKSSYCATVQARPLISADLLKPLQPEDDKDSMKQSIANLHFSRQRLELFQLLQDQQRLEAVIYASEFGGFWGSDTLFQQIYTLAEHLAEEDGVLAGLPFSFYISALHFVLSGAKLSLSADGYLQIMQLDFLTQAYTQYLHFEFISSLKAMSPQYVNQCIAQKPTFINTVFGEEFLCNWSTVQRAALIESGGFPQYMLLRSSNMAKVLFYEFIFTYRHIATPDRPGLLSFANPLFWLLNPEVRRLDLVRLAHDDKNILLSAVQTALTVFLAGGKKDLFSISLIEAHQFKMCFDTSPLLIFFARVVPRIVENSPNFAPGRFFLEMNQSYTLSSYADTSGSTGLVIYSANDLTCSLIIPINKAKGHGFNNMMVGLLLGLLVKGCNSTSLHIKPSSLESYTIQAFRTNCDTYKDLQDSACDSLEEWVLDKLNSIKKTSTQLASSNDLRIKRKSMRFLKPSSYQHKRSIPHTAEPQTIPHFDDPLFSSFVISDNDPIHQTIVRNPGLALRLARSQRTQAFGLLTLDNILQLEDVIERMFINTNYNVSNFIDKNLVSVCSNYIATDKDWSYEYETIKNQQLQYLAASSSFSIPPIYYTVATGEDQAFTLCMERILCACAYRKYLDSVQDQQNEAIVSPNEFCGYMFSIADEELRLVSSDEGDIIDQESDTPPLLAYLIGRRKVRLGSIPSSHPELNWFVTPSHSACHGTYQMAIYEAQAKIRGIHLSQREIDALYTCKVMTQPKIDMCINPLWANTIGSMEALMSSINNLVHCRFKNETLLHTASKKDHLQMISLIMLLFPLDVHDLLRSLYAVLLNHSSGALRFFFISPLLPSLSDVQTLSALDKTLPFTIDATQSENACLWRRIITDIYTLSNISNAACNVSIQSVNPLLENSQGTYLLSTLTDHTQLRNKLQELQELISSSEYYSFLAWGHLIRTLRPFCYMKIGSISCFYCFYNRTNNIRKNNILKYLSFHESHFMQEKLPLMSVSEQLFAQQCYFSGHSLHHCISLLLSAGVSIYVCTLQNMEVYNMLSGFTRDFVMAKLPIKSNEQKTSISYPDYLVIFKYLSLVYDKLGVQRQTNSNLNSIIFDRFSTPLSTPLILAAQFGSPVCCALCNIVQIIENSPDDANALGNSKAFQAYIDHRDAYGLTALHHATILFIRAFISIIKKYIGPVISFGINVTASVPVLYNIEMEIFDNEFACSILTSSRTNIKTLLSVGANPNIPDAHGVRCCDRFVAMLLALEMIRFPPGYNIQRFFEEQPTDIIMHLILWAERYKKPMRTNISLVSESSIKICMHILTKESKRVSWREELVRGFFKKLQETGHISDAVNIEALGTELAIDLSMQVVLDMHSKMTNVSSRMNTIIQANLTRVTSELSIVLRLFLDLPTYQDRANIYTTDGQVSVFPSISIPANILPLPFCSIDENGVQNYLQLWFPLPTDTQKSTSEEAAEKLLWAYGLYSVYGLRECKFSDEFSRKWGNSKDTFIRWSPDIYERDSESSVDTPVSLEKSEQAIQNLTSDETNIVPKPVCTSTEQHASLLAAINYRMGLGNSTIHYANRRDWSTEPCRRTATDRLRNYIWRKIVQQSVYAPQMGAISCDDVHSAIDITQVTSAIVDTITVPIQHAVLQSSFLTLSHDKPTNQEILSLISRSLELNAYMSDTLNSPNSLHNEKCKSIYYGQMLHYTHVTDDTALLIFRSTFRRARILSILADRLCPQSTIVFFSPDMLFFSSAWRLASCFFPCRSRYNTLDTAVDEQDGLVEDGVQPEELTSVSSTIQEIEPIDRKTLLNLIYKGSGITKLKEEGRTTRKSCQYDGTRRTCNVRKIDFPPFTPMQCGFTTILKK